jgi:hypothetical protein
VFTKELGISYLLKKMLTAEAVARARARTAKHFMVTAPLIDCCKGHWALLLFIISTLSQASTCTMTLTFSDFDCIVGTKVVGT